MDLSRTQKFIHPDWIGNRAVRVFGLGTIGSRIVISLAQDGLRRIDGYDPDSYAPENQATQRFLHEHLGTPKAVAQREYVRLHVGSDVVVPHVERVKPDAKLPGFIFTAVDDQEWRKEYWYQSLKGNEDVELLIDCRMGEDGGRIVALDPKNLEHQARYEESHLYSQEEADRTGCSTDSTIGSTADIIAGFAGWRLKRWLHLERGEMHAYENFIGFDLVPITDIEIQRW